MEDIVQRMRADISVQLEGPGIVPGQVRQHANGQTAQKVTARLASLYIEENLRDRENLADETESVSGIAAQRREGAADRARKEARSSTAASTPASCRRSSTAICRTIRNTQLQLQSISESMNRTRESAVCSSSGRSPTRKRFRPMPRLPAVAAGDKDAAASLSTAEQLEAARAQLEVYKLRFTAGSSGHPRPRAHDPGSADAGSSEEDEASARSRLPNESLFVAGAADAAEATARSPGGARRHRSSAGRRRSRRHARLKQMMAGYQSKVDVVPTRESGARRAHARLRHAAGGLHEPPDQAGGLEDRRESRAATDRRAVQDPGCRPRCPKSPSTRPSGWG